MWTLASAAIRLYAAYNISVKGFVASSLFERKELAAWLMKEGDRFYDLALISYVLALGHFASEFVVFRTAGIGPGLLSPLIVASASVPS